MKTPSQSAGQATVEYIFILAIAVMLGFAITERFSSFFQNQMGKIGHVLSSHLVIGVCPQRCWYPGYYNGYNDQ